MLSVVVLPIFARRGQEGTEFLGFVKVAARNIGHRKDIRWQKRAGGNRSEKETKRYSVLPLSWVVWSSLGGSEPIPAVGIGSAPRQVQGPEQLV